MGAQPQWDVRGVGLLVEADMPEAGSIPEPDMVGGIGVKMRQGYSSAVPFAPFDFRRESGPDQGSVVSQAGAQDDRTVRFQHRQIARKDFF